MTSLEPDDAIEVMSLTSAQTLSPRQHLFIHTKASIYPHRKHSAEEYKVLVCSSPNQRLEQLDPKTLGQEKRIRMAVTAVATVLILACVLMVAVSLMLSHRMDENVKKLIAAPSKTGTVNATAVNGGGS